MNDNHGPGRNCELTKLAGILRAKGHNEDEILEALLNAPERQDLPEFECRTIAKSAMSWPAGQPAHDSDTTIWPDNLHELANRRGWPIEAIRMIGAVSKDGGEVHFPMRDVAGEIVGWRRRLGNNQPFGGDQKCLTGKGGKNGLMIPWPFPTDDPVLVCEGEADTVAALSAGHVAVVGLPGAQPGRNVIRSLQTLVSGRGVVLAPDPDEAGDQWRVKIGETLVHAGCAVRFIPPNENDLDKRLRLATDPKAELARLIEEAVDIKTPIPKPEVIGGIRPLTDLGNAERFCDQHRGEAMFDFRNNSWRIWDECRWSRDRDGAILRLAGLTARSITVDVETEKNPKRQTVIENYAVRSEGRERLISMVFLAKSRIGMTAKPSQWDADPWLLNCQNGTVNLKTGELQPHQRDDYITRLAPIDFDPAAQHDILDQVLSTALPDEETRAYFQRLVGYSLIGQQIEDIVVFVYGPTASGKTSLTEPLRKYLGDYATALDPSTVSAKSFDRAGAASPDLAGLVGKRFVNSSELQEGMRLDAGMIKRVSGGEAIVARNLYSDPFEFVPAFTLWLISNHYPIVGASDDAIWRRLRVLPFSHSIPPDQRDPEIKKILLHECGPAVIAWAVKGAVDYFSEGLGVEPEAIQIATAEYKETQDLLLDFIEDCCVLNPYAECSNTDLRKTYEDWCEDNGVKRPLSPKKMSGELQSKGCERIRIINKRGWSGIGVRDSLVSETNLFAREQAK